MDWNVALDLCGYAFICFVIVALTTGVCVLIFNFVDACSDISKIRDKLVGDEEESE